MRHRTILLASASVAVALGLGGVAQAQSFPQNSPPPPGQPQTDPNLASGLKAPSAQPNSPTGVQRNPDPGAVAGAPPGSTSSEIVVTGVRQSVASAETIKRNADQVVDSIVAQDIGKFPDNTLADALQRVPGIQVGRNNQEINSVNIRGLPNVETTLNGREIFSGTGRLFSFQDLPAEAVARVDVYKSSSADLIEGGIAGLVNIDLHRPFDFKGLTISGTARGTYADLSDAYFPNASILVSDRWQTGIGEIGALIDVSYQKTEFLDPRTFNDVSFAYNDTAPFTKTNTGQTITVPNGVGGLYTQGERERPQANASIQWRPNSELEVYADGLYAGYRSQYQTDFFFSALPGATSVQNLVTLPQNDADCPTVPVFSATGAQNGTRQACGVLSGTFVNPYTATSTQSHTESGQDYQAALGAKWHRGPLKLSGEGSYTSSEFNTDAFIVDTSLTNQTVVVNTIADNRTNVDVLGTDINNPNAYKFEGLYQDYDRYSSQQYAARLDGEYDLGSFPILKKITAGFRYADRDYHVTGSYNISYRPPNFPTMVTSVFPGVMVPSPTGLYLANSPWLTISDSFLRNNQDLIRAYYGQPAGQPGINPLRGFDASETSYAGYVQGGYNFDLFGFALDGLAGVRVVGTDRSQQSFTNNAGVLVPADSNTSDIDVLPNFSARLHLTPDLQARFSAARTVSRPDLGALNPALNLNAPTQNVVANGSGGNPDLAPTTSNSFDGTLEWYFNRTGLISVAGFYRDITGYIQTYADTETINGITYIISRPQSAGSGDLEGVELAYQQFFDRLPGVFSGLGFQANYTYIDGSTQAPAALGGASTTTPLGQVSHHNINAVLIYEKYGFSARLADTYRSDYVDAFNVGGVQQPQTNNVKATNHLDFSGSYALTDHLLVTVDATNLTGETYGSYLGTVLRPRDYREEARTYSVGVRFKY